MSCRRQRARCPRRGPGVGDPVAQSADSTSGSALDLGFGLDLALHRQDRIRPRRDSTSGSRRRPRRHCRWRPPRSTTSRSRRRAARVRPEAGRNPLRWLELNYYRDGTDTVGWHSDNEPGLGPTPFIASLSVGAEREFLLRRISEPSHKVSVTLENGSLLVMSGETQSHWEHSLPRRKRVLGSRINLTFRQFDREP